MNTKHLGNSILKSWRIIDTKDYFIVVMNLKIISYGFHLIWLNL